MPGGVAIPDFTGSFVDYLLRGTEMLHATVRRYTSPDEHPFFEGLPASLLPPLCYDAPIAPSRVNINARIKQVYEQEIIPLFCAPGDDQQYGSSAVCDVTCLQALSKRIHYGKFVAESKFRQDETRYRAMIARGNHDELYAAITDTAVEARLLERVGRKAAAYAREIDSAQNPDGTRAAQIMYKLDPALVTRLYQTWIIPMTKDVEVEYLLARQPA